MILTKKAQPTLLFIKGYKVGLSLISFLVFFSISLHASIKDIQLERATDEKAIIQQIQAKNLTTEQITKEQIPWRHLIISAFQLNKMKLVAYLIQSSKKIKGNYNPILQAKEKQTASFWSHLLINYEDRDIEKETWDDPDNLDEKSFLARCDELFAVALKEKIVITINAKALLVAATCIKNKSIFEYFLKKGDEQHADQETYWLNGNNIKCDLGYVTFLHAIFYNKRPTEILKEVLKKVNKDPKKGINILEKSPTSTETGTALIGACDYGVPEQNALLLLDELQILYKSNKEEVIKYMNINYNPAYFEYDGSVNGKSALNRALHLYKPNPNPKETKLQLIIKLLSFEGITIQDVDISLADSYLNTNKFGIYELVLALLEGKKSKKNLITTVTDFLEEKNKVIEKEREKFEKQLKQKLEKQKEKQNQSESSLKNQINTLNSQHQANKSKIDQLQKDKSALEGTIKELREEATQKQGRETKPPIEKAWQEEKEALQKELNEAKQTIADEKANLTATRSSLARVKWIAWIASFLTVGMLMSLLYQHKKQKNEANHLTNY